MFNKLSHGSRLNVFLRRIKEPESVAFRFLSRVEIDGQTITGFFLTNFVFNKI